MKFTVMTLFPDLVRGILEESVIGRALKNEIIELKCYNIRDFSKDKHKKTDYTPFGGGSGMVMTCQPIMDCFKEVKASFAENARTRVIYMSPKGRIFNQTVAEELSEYDELIFLCGHYEGVDRRIVDEIVDEEISIGDFVLTGGEIPACILTDCVARLVDGVLSDAECYEKESISSGLLEYPQYTRPYEFHGVKVPDVLISGHHANIDRWRDEQAREMTEKLRPDLLEKQE